jgi:hypothetical protein
MSKRLTLDAITWFVIAALVLLVQRLTTSDTWGQDVWVAVIVASMGVGLYILARKRVVP